MNILELAEKLGDEVISAYGDLAFVPSGIANDHRKIVPGGLFVCIKGYVADGHDYAADALAGGAAVLIAEKPMANLKIPAPIAGKARVFLRVKNTRRALAAAAHLFYGEPSKKLLLTGVTGTKGKTTAVHMIRAILQAAGKTTGMLGTVENDIGGELIPAKETTPESIDLAGYFDKMVKRGCSHAVMEVSSQGLALSRVDFCDFDIGVFTNFYNDHISPREHGSVEEYLAAKLKLFSVCRQAVINADIKEYPAVRDAFVRNAFVRNVGAEPLTYSTGEDGAGFKTAGVRAKRIELIRGKKPHTRFYAETPWFSDTFEVGLPGKYNVSNALAAISVCGILGIDKEAMREGLRAASVRGRTELVDEYKNITVLVDYAHNAASLEALLKMLREYEYASITTVFGCGGDRARERRGEMGEVSGRYSDFTVITSDNPRSEAPERIMADIEQGLKRTAGKYIMVEDRREAIGYALKNASVGDLVLIAGKGHETAQTFSYGSVPFDDAQVAREFIRADADKYLPYNLPRNGEAERKI